MALPGQRLAGREAGTHANQLARQGLGDSEAAATALRERGHGQVVAGASERAEVSDEVGVGEHERAGRGGLLSERERLSLPTPGQPHDARARSFRLLGGCVA